ncbi:tryptophan--tRNA ligase [Patescibacteria group bacterium]|nr:MAG: tryptophan--tRNA ligase [Patescibacteria group bacterium]
MKNQRETILTGDRPTGKLHLGHYVGSLKNRVALQDVYNTFIIIADFQVLIDHLEDSHKVKTNIKEITLDYLGAGIDPAQTTIFIQSVVPQLAELTVYLSMLVTVSRLRRNPTVKSEAQRIGVDSEQDNITYGFLGYPVSQAADILLFRAHCVPAGEDQRPHIEQTRELANRFNKVFGKVFPLPELLISETPRLPGIFGEGKMSKSLGNAIYLSDSAEEVRRKVMSMYTDPTRKHASDPGHIEGNVVFTYLDAFDSDFERVADLKNKYQVGGIGDIELKNHLFEVLMNFLRPMQKRRNEFEKHPDYIQQVLKDGCARAVEIGEETMKLVRKAVGYNYADLFSAK